MAGTQWPWWEDAELEGEIQAGYLIGKPGKSAYQYAVEGGYPGTEEEFYKDLATVGETNDSNTSHGIPPGGKAGQILYKMSDDDYDVAWQDLKIPEQYGLVTYDQNRSITIT